MINASIRNLAIDMLLDLLKIYSPPRREGQAIELLKKYAEELGYEYIETDGAGNLIAGYGEGNTILASVGHIDTVPWEIPVKFDGYTVSGRGAVDAKGPLVAAFIGFALAKDMIDRKRFKVYAIAAVDEEGDSLGAKHLLKSGFRADGLIVSEPSNGNGVVVGYRGSMRIRIVCTGSGGHSSSYSEDSACEKLISIWQRLRSNYGVIDVKRNTASLLKLFCGEDAPINPRYGESIISIRISIDGDILNLKTDINNIINDFSNCNWYILDYTKPIRTSVNNPVARALTRAIIKNGLRPRILYKYGTSDMNILYPEVSQNIAAYGPGRSELAHTAVEKISVDELLQGIEVYRAVVGEFFNIFRP
ncbi:MAG: M20/M25/M40 family metallo-hydrolase [Ignisphaera sp.]